MISIHSSAGRLCDTPSRRELLTVGSLSLFGMGLPTFLRQQTLQAAPNANVSARVVNRPATADAVILVYLQGSPSHIDLWDPKPEAPAEIRGEFRPIATRAPGMMLGEVLPMLAEQAQHFTLIRSMGVKPKGLRNHGSAIYMLMTGTDPANFSVTGLAVPPSRDDLPSVGSIVAQQRPATTGGLSYVAVCGPVKEGKEVGVGQSAGILGPGFDPFLMYDDPTQPLKLDAFALPGDVTLDRLQSRVDLRATIDSQRESARSAATFDTYYERALGLVQSHRAVQAFRLDAESEATRERYGKTRFGQSCLLARRLVEAGTRFVQVTWPARSDDEPVPGPDGSWDTHRNNFPTLREHRCPFFDRTMSALIADLAQRGMLERTMVVAIGEFGRSPKIGVATTDNVGPGGRDHWPECYSCLIAGGGVRPGQIYGESDRFAAWPKSNPVHPYDLITTIYHALGIDPATEYHDSLNRPRRLVEHGQPVLGLF